MWYASPLSDHSWCHASERLVKPGSVNREDAKAQRRLGNQGIVIFVAFAPLRLRGSLDPLPNFAIAAQSFRSPIAWLTSAGV